MYINRVQLQTFWKRMTIYSFAVIISHLIWCIPTTLRPEYKEFTLLVLLASSVCWEFEFGYLCLYPLSPFRPAFSFNFNWFFKINKKFIWKGSFLFWVEQCTSIMHMFDAYWFFLLLILTWKLDWNKFLFSFHVSLWSFHFTQLHNQCCCYIRSNCIKSGNLISAHKHFVYIYSRCFPIDRESSS